ncbi:MAG TPA: site-specific DNA-methyltransferase [Candidatus Acidoferrales bacterium]|nr:site-specific DNA-methyltransferase [Candidatus Acidoferrales bacterium]
MFKIPDKLRKDFFPVGAGGVFHGDALEVLRRLPDRIVQCCITSPPYWSMKDYGVPGQIGLEKSPEEYIEKLAYVLHEVRRVMKDDGTLWLNLGDTYCRGGKSCGLRPKELVGIPWRVAFALHKGGWYLRSDIIWHKPDAMPEGVNDRPTRAHEYIFLLTKSRNYYYNPDEIREPHKLVSLKRMTYKYQGYRKAKSLSSLPHYRNPDRMCHPLGRNKRSVWTIPKRGFRGNHSATFPHQIPETCIKAGSKTGDIVLDPFAGSGTTLETAARLDRVPLGIELNERYIKELIMPSVPETA